MIAALLLLLLSTAQASETGHTDLPEPLLPGRTVEREAVAGDEHAYTIELTAGQYLRISVRQRGLDVALQLLRPDGSTLAECDGPGGAWVSELLPAIADSSGQHLLRLTTVATDGECGRYRLKIKELRDGRDNDPARVQAETMFYRGVHLRHLATAGAKEEAAALFEASAALSHTIDEPEGQAKALRILAGMALDRGESRDALQQAREAAALAAQAGDLTEEARASQLCGSILGVLGKADEARNELERARLLAERAGDQELQAAVHNALGTLAFHQGLFEEALQHFQQSRTLASADGSLREELRAITNLNALHSHRGRPDEALVGYREALALTRRIGDRIREAQIHNNMAVTLRALGRWRQALTSYTKALQLSQELGMPDIEASCTSNLGYLLILLGEWERAGALLDRALELHRACESPFWEAWTLVQKGVLLEKQQRYRDGLATYEQALQVCRSTGSAKNQVYVLRGMAHCKLQLGQSEEALSLLQQALQLADTLHDLPGQQAALLDMGSARLDLGDPDGAEAPLQRALDLALLLEDPENELFTRTEIARLLRALGNLTGSLQHTMQVLDILEKLRLEVASPEVRSTYFSKRQGAYYDAIDLLMELHAGAQDRGFDRQAFGVAERARSRTLVELLSEADLTPQAEGDGELMDQQRRSMARLTQLQRQLATTLSQESPPHEKVRDLRAELGTIKERLEQLDLLIHAQDPRMAAIRSPSPVGVPEAQQLLDDDTALLEYVLGKERSFVFVVTRTGFWCETLPSGTQISTLADDLRHLIEQPRTRLTQRYFQAAGELYDLLVRPAEPHLAKISQLLITQDRGLYQIPVEVLVDHGETTDTPLIERWSVAYVPSATTLATLQSSGSAARSTQKPVLVALADPELQGDLRLPDPLTSQMRGPGSGQAPPDESQLTLRGLFDREDWHWQALPGSRREVERIAALLEPDQVRLELGAAATELSVKHSSAVARARWLHFACHGLVDEQHPAYSTLLLAPDEQGREDGFLQAHEVLVLELDAELVVLSACETGLGKEIHGEGLVGLTQAFLRAGAGAVVVSLWPVADRSTEELMVLFYKALLAGNSPVEALRRAKLTLYRQAGTGHPFFWSPFILVGGSHG